MSIVADTLDMIAAVLEAVGPGPIPGLVPGTAALARLGSDIARDGLPLASEVEQLRITRIRPASPEVDEARGALADELDRRWPR